MSNVSHQLREMVDKSNVARSGLIVEKELRPLPEQYALKTGDWAVSLRGDSLVDEDATLVQLVDPMDYVNEYPDYVTRIANSYVLAKWRTTENPLTHVGWYARCRLIPLYEGEIEEILKGFDGDMTKPPEWLLDRYHGMMDRVSEAAPEAIAKAPTCSCGSRDVVLHLNVQGDAVSPAGVVKQNGKNVYTTIAPFTFEMSAGAHLHCRSCGEETSLTSDQVDKEIRWPQ